MKIRNRSFLAWIAACGLLTAVSFAYSSFEMTSTVWAKESEPESNLVKNGADYLPAKSTKASEEGRRLVAKNQCMMCHSIEGAGGCMAPPLDGIGARRSKSFLLSRITDSKREEQKFLEVFGQSELMPHVRVPKKSSSKIVAFLLTLPKQQKGYKVVGHKVSLDKEQKEKLVAQFEGPSPKDGKLSGKDKLLAQDIEKGKRLVSQKGCQACHSIGKIGGELGPNLDGVGKRKKVMEIAESILAAELVSLKDQKEYGKPAMRMPASHLSLEDIRAISRFLATLK